MQKIEQLQLPVHDTEDDILHRGHRHHFFSVVKVTHHHRVETASWLRAVGPPLLRSG